MNLSMADRIGMKGRLSTLFYPNARYRTFTALQEHYDFTYDSHNAILSVLHES